MSISTKAGLKKLIAKLKERDDDGGGPLAIDLTTLSELLEHPAYGGGPSAPDNAAAYQRVRAYFKKLCDGRDLGPELYSRG